MHNLSHGDEVTITHPAYRATPRARVINVYAGVVEYVQAQYPELKAPSGWMVNVVLANGRAPVLPIEYLAGVGEVESTGRAPMQFEERTHSRVSGVSGGVKAIDGRSVVEQMMISWAGKRGKPQRGLVLSVHPGRVTTGQLHVQRPNRDKATWVDVHQTPVTIEE